MADTSGHIFEESGMHRHLLLHNRHNVGIIDRIFDIIIRHCSRDICKLDADVDHKLIADTAFLFEDSDMTVDTESLDDYRFQSLKVKEVKG